jgi:hypothetical protein
MAGGLGFLFDVGGPSSWSVTDLDGLLPLLQRGSRDPRTYWRAATVIWGKACSTSPTGLAESK